MKTLFVDLETAPSLGWFFGKMYETNILDLKKGWYVLMYSYRWDDDPKIRSIALTDFPKQYKKDPEDDSALCGELWKLFDRAEIIVAHNVRFDVRVANARFLKHGFPPYSPTKTYCTLAAARKIAAFTSNKLNDLGRYFGLGRKLEHTGWNLWRKVMHGNLEAVATMRRYCMRDVELLYKVYKRLRPWTPHPRVPHPAQVTHCPKCASHRSSKRGLKHFKTYSSQQRQCLDCKSWFLAERVE